ncbi:MAG: right-handed parallel beta-helix repeat-containing protein [Phycisphaerales bacterium]|nr:MAG: right-handed parallel beta-helix repeat-containing protein [Phycisphaerales bacterium]
MTARLFCLVAVITWSASPALGEFDSGSDGSDGALEGGDNIAVTVGRADHDTIMVCWDGSEHFTTIQEGIDDASDGDEVVLCEGTYTGVGNRDLDFAGGAITVRSTDPDNPDVVAATVIDCEGTQTDPHRAFTFHSGEGPDSVIAGLTIINGYGPTEEFAGDPYSAGGAIFCRGSNPTIRDCTITANATDEFGYGGGICCDGSSPTITNCTFSENSAGLGGAIYARVSISPRISNCTMSANSSYYDGAGVFCTNSSIAISNTRIASNTAERAGGGLCFRESSSAVIDDSEITLNHGLGAGGGLYSAGSSNVIMSRCAVIGNSGGAGGGAYFTESRAAFSACRIIGNSATSGGGLYFSGTDATIANSIMAGNAVAEGGGGFLDAGSSAVTMRNCMVIGNAASRGGGARYYLGNSAAPIVNCMFIGNTAGRLGGGFYLQNHPSLTNCTLSGNSAGADAPHPTDPNGGGIYYQYAESSPTLTNVIVWGNSPDQILRGSGGEPMVISYSDVEGGASGPGNINADPQWVGGGTGIWTGAGVYDPETFRVVLTDFAASWEPGELVGKLINPDTSQWHQSMIVANTATRITIWADWDTINAGTSWINSGRSYRIYDYHLASFVSPCVDTGDPGHVPHPGEKTDIDGEMRIWDGDGDGQARVDMGTDECGSKCFSECMTGPAPDEPYQQGCEAFDFDDDGEVDLQDFGAFQVWFTNP